MRARPTSSSGGRAGPGRVGRGAPVGASRRFLATFAVTGVLLTALVESDRFGRPLHAPLTRWLALVASACLRVLGPSSHSASLVVYAGFTLEIVPACDGLLPSALFAAAVLAYPSRWIDKGKGLLFGLPAIALVNLGRLTSLMVVGARRPDLFEAVHIYAWQALIIAATLLLWLLWVERLARAPHERRA